MKAGNKGIIRKIIKRSLSSDKKRNFFIIAAITLTTLMIASVLSIGMGLYESTRIQRIRLTGSTSHAAFPYPTANQLERMKDLDYVKTIGTGNYVAFIQSASLISNSSFGMAYFDENLFNEIHIPAWTHIVGVYPQKANEIMASCWILEKIGIENPEIGMSIPLSYTVDDGDTVYDEVFVLSGYYTSFNHVSSNESNVLMVSEELSSRYGKSVESDGSVNVIFKDTRNIEQYIERLKLDLELSDNQVIAISPIYEVRLSEQIMTVIAFVLIIVFMIFAGYLLIYNVLYISVSKDIRYYGLLKTIGATPKQLYRIVIGIAMRLCIVGIPLGALLAGLLSLVIVPLIVSGSNIETGTVVSFSPIIYIGAALFALITAFIGAFTPAKKVSHITPIEAVRYSGEHISKSKVYGSANGKPYKMALRNIFRDKKRAFVVFLSLFLSLTTFITVITIVSSMDIDKYAESSLPNDFSVQNEAITAFKQKFDSESLNRIKELPGFEKMQIVRVGWGSVKYTPAFETYLNWYIQSRTEQGNPINREDIISGFSGIIIGIDTEALAEINDSLPVPIDLQAFGRGDFALIATDDSVLYSDVEEIEITISPSDTDTLIIPVGGFVPYSFRYTRQSIGTIGPLFFVSNELIKNLDDPLVQLINFDVEEGYDEQTLNTLKETFGNDYEISMTSRLKLRQDMREAKIILYILGGGVSLILGLIGIFNFINVMSVGIMVRKRELATLESIGMNKKQMRKMLISEGIGYAVITLILVAIIGNGIAYGAFKLLQNQASYAIFTYPLYPVVLVAILVMGICVVTPDIVYRLISNASIVERLREIE